MLLEKVKGRMYCKPIPRGGQEVILAGAESPTFRKLFKAAGVKSVLLSYFYLRKMLNKGTESIENLKADLQDFDLVYIDSGGYTLQIHVKNKKLDTDLLGYIEDYYQFAETMKGYVTVFGAVDSIDKEQKFTHKEMYEKCYEAKDRGIHIAPTIFPSWGWEFAKYYELDEEFLYLGISGAGKKHISKGAGLITQLTRTNLMHGYAMTSPDEFRTFPFRSVDSLTWLGGQKYGSTYVFTNGRIKTYNLAQKKAIRKSLWALCEKHGIDFALIEREEVEYRKHKKVSTEVYMEINKLNLIAWTQFADYQRQSRHRAYWLKLHRPIYYNTETKEIILPPELKNFMDTAMNLEEPEFVEVPDEGEDEPENLSTGANPDRLVVGETKAMLVPSEYKKVATSKSYMQNCDTCFVSDRCKLYKEGYECSLDFSGESSTLNELVTSVVKAQETRLNRAMYFESLNGGVLDPQISNELARFISLVELGTNLNRPQQPTIKFEVQGNEAVSAVSNKGGILSQLLGSKEEHNEKIIIPKENPQET